MAFRRQIFFVFLTLGGSVYVALGETLATTYPSVVKQEVQAYVANQSLVKSAVYPVAALRSSQQPQCKLHPATSKSPVADSAPHCYRA